MSSGPPGAGLILHQEGQASRKEDVAGLLLMPGTQVSSCVLRGEGRKTKIAAQASWREQQPLALLSGTARTMEMASVPPRNPLVPSLHVSSTTSPSLPPSKDASQTPGSAFPQGFWAAPLGAQGLPWSALAGITAAMGGAGPSALPSPSAGKSGHSLSFQMRINRYYVNVLRIRLNTGKETRATQGEKMVDTYCM